MSITRWKPDTCNCVIEYEWDASLPVEQRVHTAVKTTPCQFHLGTVEEVYTKVKDENVKKNLTRKLLLETIPEISQDEVDNEGNVVGKKEKTGVNFFFEYNPQRELLITFTGIDQATKLKVDKEVKKLENVKLV